MKEEGTVKRKPRAVRSPTARDAIMRLDVYVVDSGLDALPRQVLRRFEKIMERFLDSHNLHVLSEEESIEFLKDFPQYVGRDPLLAVVDPLARKMKNPKGFGAVVALGHIDSETRIEALIKMFLRLVRSHKGTLDIAYSFREQNHKRGMKGAVDIVMESIGPGRH